MKKTCEHGGSACPCGQPADHAYVMMTVKGDLGRIRLCDSHAARWENWVNTNRMAGHMERETTET